MNDEYERTVRLVAIIGQEGGERPNWAVHNNFNEAGR